MFQMPMPFRLWLWNCLRLCQVPERLRVSLVWIPEVSIRRRLTGKKACKRELLSKRILPLLRKPWLSVTPLLHRNKRDQILRHGRFQGAQWSRRLVLHEPFREAEQLQAQRWAQKVNCQNQNFRKVMWLSSVSVLSSIIPFPVIRKRGILTANGLVFAAFAASSLEAVSRALAASASRRCASFFSSLAAYRPFRRSPLHARTLLDNDVNIERCQSQRLRTFPLSPDRMSVNSPKHKGRGPWDYPQKGTRAAQAASRDLNILYIERR